MENDVAKMETHIAARREGTVTVLHVAAGDVLATITAPA